MFCWFFNFSLVFSPFFVNATFWLQNQLIYCYLINIELAGYSKVALETKMKMPDGHEFYIAIIAIIISLHNNKFFKDTKIQSVNRL